MTFTILDKNIEYFSFNNESFAGTTHGFFTRNGGVSEGIYSTLNLGGSIGDNPENVIENRHRVFDAIGRDSQSMFDVWQVHGTEIKFADRSRNLSIPPVKSDAIFTNKLEVTLLMRFADCVPIIIYDPVKRVVGIVHAGWKGTVDHIAEKAIIEIGRHYGCVPGDIIAGIGPSIGPDHYFVGEDVFDKVIVAFNNEYEDILTRENGKIKFDLWKANEYILRNTGVRKVVQTNICTACDTQRWYSHRAENGNTGRFAAIIGLVG